jgi:hypothetical protein
MTTSNQIQPTSVLSLKDFIHLRINKQILTAIIFYTVFFLIFCFSGSLSILSILTSLPYRMGLVSALTLPLILLYGIRVNKVFITYGLLTVIIFLSGLYNGVSCTNILLFMRSLIFSFLIYKLVDMYLRPGNIHRVLNWCIVISVLQLPVLILQRLSYTHLPTIITKNVIRLDFDFGTFNLKGDAQMAFFLTSIVIFLLFNKRQSYIVKYKWIILGWLTLTIFIANSELLKITVSLVWAVYFFTHARAKIIIYSGAVFICIFGLLAVSGALNQVWSRFWYSVQTNTQLTSEREQRFLSGNYARGTAIAYYLNREIMLLGDGPSRYYNVFTRERVLGNTGHIFTFYSEVGSLGWLASAAIFFLIAFPIHRGRITISWVSLLIFTSIQLLSFTAEIMNDVSIVLTYCIFTKAYLLIPQTNLMKKQITAPGTAINDIPLAVE